MSSNAQCLPGLPIGAEEVNIHYQDISEAETNQGFGVYQVIWGQVHVCPLFPGEPQHAIHPLCWCEPERQDVDDGVIWSHRRMQ